MFIISIWSYTRITDAEYKNHLNYEYDTVSILYARNKYGIEITHEININVTAIRSSLLLSFPIWSIWMISQFYDHCTDGRTPWTGDQLAARPLPKHRITQTQNKRIHTHTKRP
jgi:hypothetical protein